MHYPELLHSTHPKQTLGSHYFMKKQWNQDIVKPIYNTSWSIVKITNILIATENRMDMKSQPFLQRNQEDWIK